MSEPTIEQLQSADYSDWVNTVIPLEQVLGHLEQLSDDEKYMAVVRFLFTHDAKDFKTDSTSEPCIRFGDETPRYVGK